MDPQACNDRGFAALIGVLVLGAVAATTASALVFASTNSLQASLGLRQYYEAKGIARACADVALRQIHDNVLYTGSGSVTLGAGSCTYGVANSGGSVRTISVTATVANVTKKLLISTSALSPKIVISSWREV
ncbi:MAG: hypothetical protein WCO25_02060 [Candidatus Uhrbacteria bacterium]